MIYALAIESDIAFVLVLALEPEQNTAEERAGHGHSDGHEQVRIALDGAGNEHGHLLRRVIRYGNIARSGERVVME